MLPTGFRRAIARRHNPAKRRPSLSSRRFLATPAHPPRGDFPGNVQAAPPIHFTEHPDQFARNRPRAELVQHDRWRSSVSSRDNGDNNDLLRRIRIMPASPSYFTATPRYIDDLLHLSNLLRRYQLLPLLPPGQAPRVAWKTIDQYKTETAEPVRAKNFKQLITLLKRLNYIHTAVRPAEVSLALERYKRDVQPHLNVPKPITVDEYGRARAVGRRKSSRAQVYVVQGEGECMVNGRSLATYFARLHDRESAVWALKATARLDKYNIWASAHGGGTTGQAEAITLAVAKALLAHEPGLKPALRQAGTLTRDRRRVERKKPGHLKARKMPTWVKR